MSAVGNAKWRFATRKISRLLMPSGYDAMYFTAEIIRSNTLTTLHLNMLLRSPEQLSEAFPIVAMFMVVRIISFGLQFLQSRIRFDNYTKRSSKFKQNIEYCPKFLQRSFLPHTIISYGFAKIKYSLKIDILNPSSCS